MIGSARFFPIMFVAVSISLAATGVGAQPDSPYGFFGDVSLDFAASPEQFTDYYVMGYGLSLGMEYRTQSNWSLLGLVNIRRFSPDEGMIQDWWDDEGEQGGPDAENIRVLGGTGGAVTIAVLGKGRLMSPGSRFYPYLKGGFGLSIAGSEEVIVEWEENGFSYKYETWGFADETNFSIILALGLEKVLGDGGKQLYIDFGLHMFMTDPENLSVVPFTLGMNF